jgi:ATP-binding cassette subfamily B protein
MNTQFVFIARALRLIWTASGRWTISWAGLSLVQGIIPAALVYLMKWLVDALAQSVGAGTARDRAIVILVPAGLTAAIMVAQRLLSGLTEWVNTAQTQMVQDHIKGLIHEKASSVDYAFFESPEYFDQFQQANSQASVRTLNLLRNIGGLAQSAVTFVSIAVILLRYSFWLPILLLASSGPAFWVLMRHNRRYHAWWKDMTSNRRWATYLDGVLTSQGAAAEMRIYDLAEFFITKHRTIRNQMRREELDLARRRILAKLTAGSMALVVTGLAMGWIVWRAMRGEATLGDLALFYQSFNQGQSLAATLLNNMGEIQSNALFLEQVFEYLDQGNLIRDPEQPVAFPPVLRRGILFDDVSFTYPDAERPSIDQFRLEIPAGKIVAVVGANGAGKSTLIKLLCRFYDPGQGEVTIDGVRLREMALGDLRRQISVMFQFPVRYHLTVAQNIEVGDLHAEHGLVQIEAAAQGAGADGFIERLPRKYDNLLGRSFEDAAELSGGEWQRIALARAFLRQAQVVVLDEPTSLMDSWGEAEWLERFRTLVHGRTVLIITHRFTTAMQADIIHVMDGGRIIESGTHSELLDRGGRYAASWRDQLRQGFGDLENKQQAS